MLPNSTSKSSLRNAKQLDEENNKKSENEAHKVGSKLQREKESPIGCEMEKKAHTVGKMRTARSGSTMVSVALAAAAAAAAECEFRVSRRDR